MKLLKLRNIKPRGPNSIFFLIHYSFKANCYQHIALIEKKSFIFISLPEHFPLTWVWLTNLRDGTVLVSDQPWSITYVESKNLHRGCLNWSLKTSGTKENYEDLSWYKANKSNQFYLSHIAVLKIWHLITLSSLDRKYGKGIKSKNTEGVLFTLH